MAEMTMQEASQAAHAILTAMIGDDLETAEKLIDELEKPNVTYVIAALCGSVSGIILAATPFGVDKAAFQARLLAGVGIDLARDTD